MNKIEGIEKCQIIIGEKVKLRPINIDDTKMILKWRNSPTVQKNFIFQEELTEEMHLKWLNNKVGSGEVIQYIIEDALLHKPIGSVYFRDIDYVNESAEYGIFIGEENARGKGLGLETTKLFVDFGFKGIGLHRISLRVLSENTIAYKAYQKAGFCEEGRFKDAVKIKDEYKTIVFMAIIA